MRPTSPVIRMKAQNRAQDGERVAWIQLRSERDYVHLDYSVRPSGEEWQTVSETVAIIRVPGRYGGERTYFVCPGVVNGNVCGRRVVKLYGGGRYFLCRHCYRLTYASQREGEWDRLIREATKIRTRLADPASTASTLTLSTPEQVMLARTPSRQQPRGCVHYRAHVIHALVHAGHRAYTVG
jgi:hypothetical protein